MTGAGAISGSPSITLSNGGILDITGTPGSTFTLASSQNLYAGTGGTVNGNNFVTSGTSGIYPGTDGGIGTLSLGGGVTMSYGSTMNFDLSASHSGANDQLVMTGSLPLVLNSNAFHIKAPSATTSLDQGADYVLITSTGGGGITGSFASAPIFDVAPPNANNYSIVTTPTTVTLHYSSVGLPTLSGSVTPNPALAGSTIFVTVNATNGGGGTIATVTASVGGSGTTKTLVQQSSAGTSGVWTNSLLAPSSLAPGAHAVVVVITDFICPFLYDVRGRLYVEWSQRGGPKLG
jgi:hypothetical protein